MNQNKGSKRGRKPQTITQKERKPLSMTTKLLFVLGGLLAAVLVFILLLGSLGDKINRVHSADYPYSVIVNQRDVECERILLDSQPTYMDRYRMKGEKEDYYLSVTRIDPEQDLEEALEAFQKEGDYTFDIEEGVTIGTGQYVAKKISYTDTSGSRKADISYYYLEKEGLLVTTCTDAKHKSEIEAILQSFTIE